ncbi:DEAD/DEAH box helicase [Candidatus Epulonipiscium viviparus]|uniref:DEAD/DEAH box helicase n=1 Tax=Candidatus Epulonipiscium viviparus TaxID=420336 RepID=UPI003A7F394F
MNTKLFEELPIIKEIKKAIKDLGFQHTTPIQEEAIPYAIEGKDIIAQAPTGTGKTCAFAIPAIQNIDASVEAVQVLVLCPTRELAVQIATEMKKICAHKKDIGILAVYGGESIEKQLAGLRRRPQIVVGTPGRVMDHMRRKTLKLGALKMLVLDEADEMLNMGFREDIDTILESIPENRQFLLFSATLPKAIMEIANKYQTNAVKINTTKKQVTVKTISQHYLDVNEKKKSEVLARLIDSNNFKLMLVFCNTKKRVDDLCKDLMSRGYKAEALHGDMKQIHRDSVMNKFRRGIVDILIATDVAARGIDIDDVDAVFNYDLPIDDEYYVHRIGRTGRANRKGTSYSFVCGKEIYKLRQIERYTNSKITKITIPTMDDIKGNKVNSILDEIKEEIKEGKITTNLAFITQIAQELNAECEELDITSTEVAAAFLNVAMKKMVTGSNPRVKLADLEHEDKKTTTYGYNEKGYKRLFINLGNKDKLESSQLVKFVASNTSVSGKEIGKIDMLDKFSFLEVPAKYVDELIAVLPKKKFKGRKVNIEVANKKKKK